VDFIIPHLGSFMDDWRAQVAFLDPLSRHPNIHTDSSGVRRFDLLVDALRRAGPEKLLFGSDGPWLHPGLELHKIRLLGMTPAAARLVCAQNLLRLTAGARRRPRGRVPIALSPAGNAPAAPHVVTARARRTDPWAGHQFPVGGR
jgi:hypothetical protein